MRANPLDADLECGGYSAGHPWYYVRGGSVPTLRQIRAYAVRFEKRGYMAEEIEAAHKLPEPRRGAALDKIRAQVLQSLRADIRGYRRAARQLGAYRHQFGLREEPPRCEDAHVAMSLKFCHILNDFIHLQILDDLPSQLSLF